MKSLVTFLIFIFPSVFAFSQEIQFKVKSGNLDYLNCPVNIELKETWTNDPGNYRLYEVINNKLTAIPFQIEGGKRLFLWFVIEGEFNRGEEREFVLKLEKGERISAIMEVNVDHEKLELIERGSKILRYQVEELYPPEGIDPIYKRSAFIHPLWSPGGEILTNILHPKHLHHYGIWSPWTKTHINGREIDYWNLGKGEGTVRFKSLPSSFSGGLFSGFTSVHEHVDFGGVGPDRVTMMETWDIKAWKLNDNRSARIIDYHSQIYNNIDDTIIFDAYRYGGGIAFRATGKWRKGTCTVLTSEGFTRNNADGERARWCIIEGVSSVKEGRSGILFISHPFNYDYPEALRVWPDDAEGGTGELMFDYCPARLNDWIIEPGKNYNLNYRMVVFDGEMSAGMAEKYYNAYCFPPEVEIITQSTMK